VSRTAIAESASTGAKSTSPASAPATSSVRFATSCQPSSAGLLRSEIGPSPRRISVGLFISRSGRRRSPNTRHPAAEPAISTFCSASSVNGPTRMIASDLERCTSS
jgi:hypothetical protein